jgi:hypothetical protein
MLSACPSIAAVTATTEDIKKAYRAFIDHINTDVR